MNSNGLSVYIEGSNWDGLTEQGDGFYVHQEIDIPIGLVGDQWKIILIALEHYKNNHLPYEDDCGLYGIEFFDNLISWIRKGLHAFACGRVTLRNKIYKFPTSDFV